MTDRIHASQLPALRLALILAFAVVAAGCGLFNPDKPDKPKPPQPFEYRDLSTPQNVLYNLRDSWERKDSVRTIDIYDRGYVGSSTEGNVTTTFSKDQELATIGALSHDQNVSTITFTLPDSSTWVRQTFSSDPGWTTISLQAYNIQVDDAVKGTLIAHPTPGSTFDFKFVPTLDAASPTDTTWKIIRWDETVPPSQ
jgi:hypothetical protein